MSTIEILVIVFSAVLAVAWVPIAVYFWKSWKQRGSPLSLAICALIAYPIFTNVSSTIFLLGNEVQTVQVMMGVNLLLLMNFLVCFRWQKERFPEARTRPNALRNPPDFWKIPADEAKTGEIEVRKLGDDDKTPPRS